MKKKILGLLIALSLVLTACSGGGNTGQDGEIQEIKVGIVQFSEHLALDRAREGFVEELETLGYKVDADVVNIQQDMTIIPTSASKFQGDQVDLIYAIATPVAQGMKSSITDIPIIFNAVTDPESADLIGDNITGVSDYFPIEKQLDLFMEEFPDIETFGVLYSLGEANSEAQIQELRQVCADRGLSLEEVAVNTTNDVTQAMASLTPKIDAFILIQDNLAASAAPVIANTLAEESIPSFAGEPGPVEEGILLSDGIDYFVLGQEAAKIANRIIQGEEPGDIETFYLEEATRVVNKATADKLGIGEDSKIFENATIVE